VELAVIFPMTPTFTFVDWIYVSLHLLVAVGWISLLYRIHAEERVLSEHPDWPNYIARVRYRLVPGLW
jgi:protein-S-isoprenylcysteine O-methyltransferase Ste14